jgi:alginate O-acetyltransferase complex protein AlgJ
VNHWVDTDKNDTKPRDANQRSQRTHPAPSAFVGIAFIVIILLGTIGSVLTLPKIVVADDRRVIDGGWMVAFQSAYEDALPYRETFIHLWSVVRYRLFHEGSPGVVVGDGGWLFTSEELSVERGDDRRTASAIEEIKAIGSRLAAEDVLLVVAIVPSKARVAADRLSGFSFPEEAADRYQRVRIALDGEDYIIAPDLLTPLAEHHARAPAAHPFPYLLTDTHWSPEGARTAAEAIGAAARPLFTDRRVPATTFETLQTEREEYQGDLLRFIPVGPYATRLDLVMTETVTIYETVPTASAGGLFADPVIPGALVGTSYSAGERWNFEGFLKDALAADLVNVAVEGQGPFIPMREYLESDTFAEFPPRFIVWEIPERYLPRYESTTTPRSAAGI